jgi:NAD-dependent SIR2 family protein deacetylase
VSAPARLAELIRGRQPCVVLTGAGVSTESGIPDFRSPTGVWAEVDPMEYASLAAFRRDPEKVWSFYALRFRMLIDAEPNAAHHALAELERRGYVRAVVTQNIDLLHERAGSSDVVVVLGRGAAQRPFLEHAPAALADRALELVRDSGPLAQCVCLHAGMPVQASSLALGFAHTSSHSS